GRCAACGSPAAFDVERDGVEQKLEAITGEIVDLDLDDDFLGMPEAVRDEYVQVFAGADPEDFLREECQHQIDAWRQKGFDVAPVEQLLAEDLSSFRAGGTRLSRLQAMKQAGERTCSPSRGTRPYSSRHTSRWRFSPSRPGWASMKSCTRSSPSGTGSGPNSATIRAACSSPSSSRRRSA